jgi:uncharacterized membrane protein YoaK (UPF0700 family)
METTQVMKPATRAVVLGLVGGYVDAVGYVMLRGLFPNHVTGNLPLAAAGRSSSVLPALAMVPLWLLAVVGVSVAAGRAARRSSSTALAAALGLEAGLLAVFLGVGLMLVPDPQTLTAWTQTVVTGAGVCAMAAQSVVSRLAGYAYPTTMVTGTLTLLGMDWAQVLAGQQPAEERARLLRQVRALGRVAAAFAAGAAAGGLLVGDLRFWALLAPLAAVVACGLSERAGRRRQPQTQPGPPVPADLRTG